MVGPTRSSPTRAPSPNAPHGSHSPGRRRSQSRTTVRPRDDLAPGRDCDGPAWSAPPPASAAGPCSPRTVWCPGAASSTRRWGAARFRCRRDRRAGPPGRRRQFLEACERNHAAPSPGGVAVASAMCSRTRRRRPRRHAFRSVSSCTGMGADESHGVRRSRLPPAPARMGRHASVCARIGRWRRRRTGIRTARVATIHWACCWMSFSKLARKPC